MKLKTCPFCGGEARVAFYGSGYIPVCTQCPAMIKPLVSFSKEEQAIKAWNIRDKRNKVE